MGVAELVDAGDLAGMESVDERVVMTYVSIFFRWNVFFFSFFGRKGNVEIVFVLACV